VFDSLRLSLQLCAAQRGWLTKKLTKNCFIQTCGCAIVYIPYSTVHSVQYCTQRGCLTWKKNKLRTCQRNIEARSLNHCRCGKAIIITHSECVSVALLSSVACLVIPHFFHFMSYRAQFSKKGSYWTSNSCFDFLYIFSPQNISHRNKKSARYQQWMSVCMKGTRYSS
jgi:hypothetical protein